MDAGRDYFADLPIKQNPLMQNIKGFYQESLQRNDDAKIQHFLMTIEEFIKVLEQQQKEASDFIENRLPHIVGVEAVNFYTESFQNEGFTDETLEPWVEVKRRQNPTRPDRAKASRKILTGDTGDLGRSIEYKAGAGETKIISDTMGAGSDKDYAAPHNEGTNTAGRNRNTTIPKRQFIGKSKTLNKKIIEETTDDLKKMLK